MNAAEPFVFTACLSSMTISALMAMIALRRIAAALEGRRT